jgi:hypothetical protein
MYGLFNQSGVNCFTVRFDHLSGLVTRQRFFKHHWTSLWIMHNEIHLFITTDWS